jgi:hypothetical protein
MAVQYGLAELPEGIVLRTEENKSDQSVLKWSGVYPIPQIGDAVAINFNELGGGVVQAYFVEHGYFGLEVKLSAAPEWHYKQHPPGSKHHGRALVFGAEVSPNGFAGGENAACGKQTLGPDDLVLPCKLPAGHAGFCDTGR